MSNRLTARGGFLGAMIRHRNAANLLMLLLVLFGAWGLSGLNRQLMPTVQIRNINIVLGWQGASAEDVEKNLLVPIEAAVRYLDGVTGMSSRAREGQGTITLSYDRATNMDQAESAVRQAVAGVANLPDSAEDPVVRTMRFYEPVASIGLSGPFPESTLRRLARDMRDDLLARGLDQVSFTGYRDRVITVTVPQSRLVERDTTLSALSSAILPNLADQPSGNLSGGFDAQIRASAGDVTARQIAASPMPGQGNEKLALGDIATVAQGFNENDSLGFMRGVPAIRLSVSRAPSEDAVTAYNAIKQYVEEIRPTLPPTLKVEVFNAGAELIQQRLDLLISNGIYGMVLVLIILFLFLDARIAFWVAAGIPVSILTTFALMNAFGMTLDMISMFALLMTLGIIVDDAIVVGEHTATVFAQGKSPAEAARLGAGRMGAPVIAASLTTMAAFGPILLVGDVVGQIMAALPMVVIAVLLASLTECFLILPGHLAHSLPKKPKPPGRFRRSFDRGFGLFRDRAIVPLARLSFSARYVTAALALSGLLLSGALIASGKLNFTFFPTTEGESFNVFAAFQPGTPQQDMQGIVGDIEKAVEKVETDLAPDGEKLVRTTFANLDLDNGGVNFDVYLTPSETRSVRTPDITAAIRRIIPTVAGVERIGVREFRGGPQGRAIDIALSGTSAEKLKQASEQLQSALEGFDGVTAISDTLQYGPPEIVLKLTPAGESLGFTLADIGAQLRDAFEGRTVRTLAQNGDETTIRMREALSDTGSGALRNLWVRAPQGGYVPLSSMVTFSERQGFNRINREEGKTTVSVRADVEDGVNADGILARLENTELPRLVAQYGLSYSLGGRQAERAAAFSELGVGAVVALAVMYIIIAWIFQSYFAPLAVMLIIPFGVAGAIWGHYWMGYDISTISLMGLLGLSGILVNDSIVLVSRLQERMGEGEGLRAAAIGAAGDRLRAVLLTSLTTIGGLAPLMFEQSLQAQFLIPMAITIVFGLGFSTVLVLFLVPAFLGIGADIGALTNWLVLRGKRFELSHILRGAHLDAPRG